MSLLLSYSVVKEPTSAKGRQSCQTLTSVSSGWVSLSVKPTRLTRTRLPLECCCWKRSAGANCFAACRDRGVYVPAAPLSTTASRVVNFAPPLTIPCRGIMHNLPACLAIPAPLAAQPAVQIRVTVRFPKIPYRSGTSRNDPTPGPIPPISASRPHRRNEPPPWRGRPRNPPTLTRAAPPR